MTQIIQNGEVQLKRLNLSVTVVEEGRDSNLKGPENIFQKKYIR